MTPLENFTRVYERTLQSEQEAISLLKLIETLAWIGLGMLVVVVIAQLLILIIKINVRSELRAVKLSYDEIRDLLAIVKEYLRVAQTTNRDATETMRHVRETAKDFRIPTEGERVIERKVEEIPHKVVAEIKRSADDGVLAADRAGNEPK